MKLNRILKIKMSGDDVKHIQEKLKELGYHKGRVDGNFGQDTLMSVYNFQKDAGFNPDGIVSLRTWSKINNFDKQKENKNKDDIPYDISYITKDSLKIYDSKLKEKFFYKERSKKNTIWITNTLSNLTPPDYIKTWNQINARDKNGILKEERLKSSTHYIIGGKYNKNEIWEGKVIKNFDDNYWSYHSPLTTTTKRINQMSISIEISNLGPLHRIKDKFYTKSGLLLDESEVIELDFRGYKYWNKYTKKQIESLRKLLIFLSEKYDIDFDKDIYDENWFEYHKKWNSVGGLRTDSQLSYSRTGIFPQKEIIEMLKNL